MAGWSSCRNGSSSYVDVDVKVYDECEDRLRSLFDQVVLVFLKEECYRPVPTILGEGESVDLFKLFFLVKERGGFDSVSRDGLWGLVAKQLGLDRRVSPSIKLVYSKYLDGIEKWAMEKSGVVKWKNWNCQNDGCFAGLLHELGGEFRGLLKNSLTEKHRKPNGATGSGFKHINKRVEESELKLPNLRKRCRENSHDNEKTHTRDGKLSCVVIDDDDDDDDDAVVFMDSGFAENGLTVRKGEQEALLEMVKWLSRAAKSPHDPLIGLIPDRSKWEEHTGNEYWIQVIRAKQALLMQGSNSESRTRISLLQSYRRMHPSIYDDDHQPTERLRCSGRRLDVSKTRSCPCCNASSVSLTKPGCASCREHKNATKTRSPERTEPVAVSEATDLPLSSPTAQPSETVFPRRHVSVGPLFQAHVPQWTEPVLDSDPKWLGTCVWPLEDQETGDFLRNYSIGRGRPDSCGCDFPSSVECIRFHIAENRMELKREFGPVFFLWRFNHMGEEVSLRWTDREEKMFKDMVRSDSHHFWENALKWFPRKTRQDLVSYYFNVFLVNRRRYQNRVTPRCIDSDDDEYRFGSVGYSFGHESVRMFSSDIMICSQNSQCTDLD